jgi:hypothetical protein
VIVAVAVASGASAPATPTITSGPASPTASTSATFTFSAAPSGGSNQCKLDAGSFATCPSPKTYAGLASGSHTFQVQAVDDKGKTSGAASYTWVIDATAPSVASMTRVGATPTNAANVSWTVTFSESVTGVDVGDFALVKTGLASAGLTGVSGSGSVYTVSSSTGSGDGTLGLNLVDNDSIADSVGNKLGGTGAGNGNVTGPVYALDRTGPASAPTISSGPSGLVASTSASFSFSSGESGVAGYQCSLDGGGFAACTSPKSYSGLAQGARSFQVRAVDPLGNPGPAATRSWTVDTVAPAVPVFTQTPPDPSSSSTSSFAWTDSSPDVASYECSKENGSFQPCTTPHTYVVGVTSNGLHQLFVHAIDAAGNVSGSASYSWKVDKGSPQMFTISGSVSGLLVGAAKPVTVTLTNPNSLPIYVDALTTTLTTNGGSGGCSASNFAITQSNASTATPILVPAGSSVVVSTAPQAPQVMLVDLATSQDGCKNKSFTLNFTGTAHS